jgi:NACalpha-BTF3-like transcription factor
MFAQAIVLSTDLDIAKVENIIGSNGSVKIESVNNSKKALDSLLKDNVKFAIIRGDILERETKKENIDFKVLSKIKDSKTFLYFLVKKDVKVNSIEDLRYKKVSIGRLGTYANLYLRESMRLKDIEFDITYKSYSLKESIKELQKSNIYATLLFTVKDISEFSDIKIENPTKSMQNVISKYKSFKDISNIPYLEYYLVVRSDFENIDLLASILNDLNKKNSLLTKVDKSIGEVYSGIDTILLEFSNHQDECKKTDELYLSYKNEYKTFLKNKKKLKASIVKTKKMISILNDQSNIQDYEDEIQNIKDSVEFTYKDVDLLARQVVEDKKDCIIKSLERDYADIIKHSRDITRYIIKLRKLAAKIRQAKKSEDIRTEELEIRAEDKKERAKSFIDKIF